MALFGPGKVGSSLGRGRTLHRVDVPAVSARVIGWRVSPHSSWRMLRTGATHATLTFVSKARTYHG